MRRDRTGSGGVALAVLLLLGLVSAGCASAREERQEADLRTALQRANGELQARVAALEAEIEEGRKAKAVAAGVRPDADPPTSQHIGPLGVSPPPIKARVLAADSGEGIYLISAGERDHLKVADELTVLRGDKFVAVVVVYRVFEDRASVEVKMVNGKPFLKGEIEAGDKVVDIL